jgi:hypothetical protein
MTARRGCSMSGRCSWSRDEDVVRFAAASEAALASGWRYAVVTAWRPHVLGVLDALSAQRRGLQDPPVGHSMGGAVAYLVAMQQPDRVERLIVEDVPPPFPRERAIPERPAGSLEFDWAVVPAIIGQVNQGDQEAWDGLRVITAPTLLIGGGPQSHIRPPSLTLGRRHSRKSPAAGCGAVGNWPGRGPLVSRTARRLACFKESGAVTDPFCGGVEFFAVASPPFRVDVESVARGPREHVQVHMEYFLERGLAVGEEHIHSLARQAGTAQRPRQPVCHPENVRPEILVEGLQEVHVGPGDHQQVTLGHRLDVHERGNLLIVVDRAGLRAARHDVAEQARTPCGHLRHAGIVAQTALQLHPTFGHRTPPARARFAATRMAPLGVPGDWWLEPEVWGEVLHLETLRHDHAMTSADEYQGLNVQARPVAGLLTVEAWLRVHGLADAAVADLLEHMWQWPMVTPDSFRAWYDFHSEELQAAEAGSRCRHGLRSPASNVEPLLRTWRPCSQTS